MTQFIPSEKGVSIRYPSTAQLCIDSRDRTNPYEGGGEPYTTSPFDFQITRSANIMTGFFTRIGATELMLDWSVPNIQTGFNDTITLDVSGVSEITVTIPQGFYTVADCLDALVEELNTTSSGTWSVQVANGQVSLQNVTHTFSVFLPTTLASMLFPYASYYTFSNNQFLESPDIRLYRYLDFVSNDLTYCQDLKDNSTNPKTVDSICRFYCAYDNPLIPDTYGFPVRFGYKADSIRRAFPFPKQIRWDNIQPIGNLSFQVYGNTSFGEQINTIIPWDSTDPNETNWCLTLQVSEV